MSPLGSWMTVVLVALISTVGVWGWSQYEAQDDSDEVVLAAVQQAVTQNPIMRLSVLQDIPSPAMGDPGRPF